MGVTVQKMVDAEVSGVLFTCNPVSGDPSMVAVNASWGLGLAVVGGETTPDDYLVSKVTGEIVRRTISSKEIEYVAGRGRARDRARRGRRPTGGTRPASTTSSSPRSSRSAGGSSATSAATRTSSGRSSAAPADLHVLQTRPVTARKRGRARRLRPRRSRPRDGRLRRRQAGTDAAERGRRPRDPAADRRGGGRGAPASRRRRSRSTSAGSASRDRPAARVPARGGKTVGIVDTTTRDGNQSLWSATGLTTARHRLDRADDRPGRVPRRWTSRSSTHMAVAVRFHQEDPWERLRLVSAAMPNDAAELHHDRACASSPGCRATRT